MLAIVDKYNQTQLEVNVLKEKERSKRSLEKYGRPSVTNSGHIRREPPRKLDDYDWSRFNGGELTSKSTRKPRGRKPRPAETREAFTRDDSSLNSERPLAPISMKDVYLSDSEVGPSASGTMGKASLSDIESDVYSLMKRMSSPEKSRLASVDKSRPPISARAPCAMDARKRHEKISQMYKRVTGESSLRSAIIDDDSDDDSAD
jgi:hypothetical protein